MSSAEKARTGAPDLRDQHQTSDREFRKTVECAMRHGQTSEAVTCDSAPSRLPFEMSQRKTFLFPYRPKGSPSLGNFA